MEFLLGLIPVLKLRLHNGVSLCLKIRCSFPSLWQCSFMLIFVPEIDCLFLWGSLGVFVTSSVLFLPTCAPILSYFLQCYLIEMMIFFSEWNCLCAAEAMEYYLSLVWRLLLNSVVNVPPLTTEVLSQGTQMHTGGFIQLNAVPLQCYGPRNKMTEPCSVPLNRSSLYMPWQ